MKNFPGKREANVKSSEAYLCGGDTQQWLNRARPTCDEQNAGYLYGGDTQQ